jgi:N-acetylneuraminic acid mutarotase
MYYLLPSFLKKLVIFCLVSFFLIANSFMSMGATLIGINVTPSNPAVSRGGTQQFTVQEIFSDGSTGVLGWVTTKSSMGSVRSLFGAGTVGNALYVVGGYDGTNALNTAEKYNPATNTWTPIAPMSAPRMGLGVGVVNGILYAVGGSSSFAGSSTTMEAYDPVTNTWAPKASMNTARWQAGVVGIDGINGKLYVVGGYNGAGLATVEEYDPSTNTWTTKTSMPTTRWELSLGVINNNIYAVGGWSGTAALNTVEEYNPNLDSWATKTSMPTARFTSLSGVINNLLYVVGGGDSAISTGLAKVEAYDPGADSWTTRSDMPTPREFAAGAVLNSSLYALGGSQSISGNPPLATVEAYIPPETVTWASSDLPVATIDPNGLATVALSLLPPSSTQISATSGSISGNTTLTVDFPDLVVYSLSGQLVGGNIYASDTEGNIGNSVAFAVTPAIGFTVSFYLSTNNINTPPGTLVGSRNILNLAAGVTNSATTNFALPSLSKDNYYLCAVTDSPGDVVNETNELNNTKCTAGSFNIGPDLGVNSLSGSLAGGKIYVSDTERNSGNQPAFAVTPAIGFTVSFYLSTNNTNTPPGTLVGSRNILNLAAGATNSATTNFALPSLSKDNYYLCAVTDSPGDVVDETNEGNNTKCTAGSFNIGPDLGVNSLSGSLSGTKLYVSDTEMNSGSQPASGFMVSFYLSLDNVLDGGDIPLGSRAISGLAGGSATNSATTTFSIPSGTPSGSYYIIAVTDSGGAVAETNELNNTKATSGTVTIP